MQLLLNNKVKFACLWCCVLPDFVVQVNNIFSFVLLYSIFCVIYKRKRKRLIRKTVKYQLDHSSKIQFDFLLFWRLAFLFCFLCVCVCVCVFFFFLNYQAFEKSENDANNRLLFFVTLSHNGNNLIIKKKTLLFLFRLIVGAVSYSLFIKTFKKQEKYFIKL